MLCRQAWFRGGTEAISQPKSRNSLTFLTSLHFEATEEIKSLTNLGRRKTMVRLLRKL